MLDPTAPRPTVAGPQDQPPSVASSADETAPTSPLAPGGPSFGPPTAPGEVGTLGPYRVVKELGRGGMGAVYLTLDTRLERRVALKVMLPQFAAGRDARERFLREARAAARVKHDNVVTVHEADERDGVPYIAMEFLEGLPLDVYLKRKGRPSVLQTLRLAREAAAGLAAAHRLGLVHRDVKPANLWLEAPGGRVKVLDFGLARAVDADVELTQSGAIVGTPAYMSPEQARGLKLDHRTDLFSLGSMLYRLCTGEMPFQGPTAMSVVMAVGTEEPVPARERNPELPESLSRLIHQLLAKNPNDRPQTADEVMRRVRTVAEELTASASASAPSTSLPQLVVAPPTEKNAFADLDATEADEEASDSDSDEGGETTEPARKRSGGTGTVVAAGLVALLTAVAASALIAVKNRDGAGAKIEAPGDPAATARDTGNKAHEHVPTGGKPPAKAADTDRETAEWVLAIGGAVRIVPDPREIRAAAELPRGPFALKYVNLDGTGVTDADLARLKDCAGLRYLILDNTRVTDAGLAHFRNCTTLLGIYLNDTRATDAGLAHFSGCKGLQELGLNGTRVTDAGLTPFVGCKELRSLALGETAVTDAGLTRFTGCAGLRALALSGTAVTDAGLAHFHGCTGLFSLNLARTAVTDAGLAPFKNCRELVNLMVQRTKASPKLVEEFARVLPACRIRWDGGVIEPKK